MAEWPAAAGEAEKREDHPTAAPGSVRPRRPRPRASAAWSIHVSGLHRQNSEVKMAVITSHLTNTAMAEGQGEGDSMARFWTVPHLWRPRKNCEVTLTR